MNRMLVEIQIKSNFNFWWSFREMRNMSLESREKAILVIKWWRTCLDCVSVLFCERRTWKWWNWKFGWGDFSEKCARNSYIPLDYLQEDVNREKWMKKELLSKKQPELKDLENFQPVHTAKNEKVYLKENTKGVADHLVRRWVWMWNMDLISHFDMWLYQQRHCQFELNGGKESRMKRKKAVKLLRSCRT